MHIYIQKSFQFRVTVKKNIIFIYLLCSLVIVHIGPISKPPLETKIFGSDFLHTYRLKYVIFHCYTGFGR